jgi:hypothetical protein
VAASDDGHDEGSGISVDAVPAAFRSPPPHEPAVDDASTGSDEGQDVVGADLERDVASPSGHRRRWVVLAAGVVVIGIAAGVIATSRHSPSDSPPDSPSVRLYLNSYDVSFQVT